MTRFSHSDMKRPNFQDSKTKRAPSALIRRPFALEMEARLHLPFSWKRYLPGGTTNSRCPSFAACLIRSIISTAALRCAALASAESVEGSCHWPAKQDARRRQAKREQRSKAV